MIINAPQKPMTPLTDEGIRKHEPSALRAETYSFESDNSKETKKAKGTKKCVLKNNLTFEKCKKSVLKNEIILRSQFRFKSDHHNVYTEEINKVAISSNDDRRIQAFDGVTTYAYGTNAFKVCESEMITKTKDKQIAMYY